MLAILKRLVVAIIDLHTSTQRSAHKHELLELGYEGKLPALIILPALAAQGRYQTDEPSRRQDLCAPALTSMWPNAEGAEKV